MAFRNFVEALVKVARRFPLPLLFSICFFALAAQPDFKSRGIWLAILFCGFFWFLAVNLIAEASKWKAGVSYGVGVVVFGGMAWLLAMSPSIIIPLKFLGPGLFVLVFVAPYLGGKAKDILLWSFAYRLALRLAVTIVASIILFLGLSAILASLEFLFDLKVPGEFYWHYWLLCACAVAPAFTMAGIPHRFDEQEGKFPEPIRIVLSYIVVPLLIVYAVLLYVYIAKIAVTWALPKGGVAYLVSVFGTAGIFVGIVGYPWLGADGIIRSFIKLFFWILPVPLVLMLIGTLERIREYGITEERYAVFLGFAWLFFSTTYALLMRDRFSPRPILSCVAILLLAGAFGPWGAVNVSTWSQIHRLQIVLSRNAMLVGSHIRKPPAAVSRDDLITISSIVDYLVETRKTERLGLWFAAKPSAYIHTFISSGDKTYSAPEKIVKDMGLDYISSYYTHESENQHFAFEADNRGRVAVSGYDYLVRTFYLPNARALKTTSADPDSIKTSMARNIYSVMVGPKTTIRFDLGELIKRKNADDKIPLFLEGKEGNVRVRLVIDSIRGSIDEKSGDLYVEYMDAVLLTKGK